MTKTQEITPELLILEDKIKEDLRLGLTISECILKHDHSTVYVRRIAASIGWDSSWTTKKVSVNAERNKGIADKYRTGDFTLQEIALEHGISRERVRQLLIGTDATYEALQKVRKQGAILEGKDKEDFLKGKYSVAALGKHIDLPEAFTLAAIGKLTEEEFYSWRKSVVKNNYDKRRDGYLKRMEIPLKVQHLTLKEIVQACIDGGSSIHNKNSLTVAMVSCRKYFGWFPQKRLPTIKLLTYAQHLDALYLKDKEKYTYHAGRFAVGGV